MIIGLMGRIGSGKGTVSEILQNEYGFKAITIGDLAREETIARGLEPTRENTTKVSTELLSKDPKYFIKKAIEQIKNSSHKNWIIDGIRRPMDVEEFKKAFPDIIFIEVYVDPKIRFERLKERGRPGFPKTYEEFLEHEKLEDEKFNILKTLSYADYKIENNGTLDELKENVKNLIKKLLNTKN